MSCSPRLLRAALFVTTAAMVGLISRPREAYAFCPCYTASSSSNDHSCGIEAVPGKNPSLSQWQEIFTLVAQGPAAWGAQGPDVGSIGQGCGRPEASHQVSARFPCELLKAIAMQESGWRQFCEPDRPSDQVGKSSRTIISFDCGYGIGQVTSGMHVGESPPFDRARVASDATYNLAAGTLILADKWKSAECVGDNQPAIVEHWYSAAWAYNGTAYVNNPTNPAYDSDRGIWDPSVGGGAPYQEKVFGWIEHPPTADHWQAVALAYPALGELGGGGTPDALDEPSCASPTDCSRKRTAHHSGCFAAPAQTSDAGSPGSEHGRDAGTSGPSTPEATPEPGLGLGPSVSLVRLAEGRGGCGCQGTSGPSAFIVAALLSLAAWKGARASP